MNLSLIICTRDRANLLKTCLQSLSQSSTELHEVIVVDQSSDIGPTRSILQELSPIIPTLRHVPTETRGLSKARNVGIKVSTGDIIAFTDDDCIVTKNWAGAIVGEFKRDKKIMAVYGKVPPVFDGGDNKKLLAIRLKADRQEYNSLVNPWEFQSGNNMALRRGVFEKIGYFDELLGPGAELRNCDDADMAYRLLRNGLKVIYTPEAVIYHRLWREDLEALRVEKDYNIGAGALFIKHLRYGDVYVLKLILDRLLFRGIGNIALATLTRNKHRLLKGYCYLFVTKGIWKGLMKPLSFEHRVFSTSD
jgi:glycosyltransferase involved in cell wall biosynthesis